MIINVRGTSGSGKTHLIKSVMSLYQAKMPLHRFGRKQPYGYVLDRTIAYAGMPPGPTGLFIPGHYEVACGGCDTLSGYEESYGLIRQYDDKGYDVLYEGLLISGEAARPIALHTEGRKLQVVALNTPIEECIASINARRQAKRGPDAPPIKEKNTRAKARACELAIKRMREAGIMCLELDREAALAHVKELLLL